MCQLIFLIPFDFCRLSLIFSYTFRHLLLQFINYFVTFFRIRFLHIIYFIFLLILFYLFFKKAIDIQPDMYYILITVIVIIIG